MSQSDDADVTARASEAFSTLSNDTRLSILRALFESDADGLVRPTDRSFSSLFEATGEQTTAGFAYHLRQLVGSFIEKDESGERYRLTYAGLRVAREMAAGTYTDSVDLEPVDLADPCPFCAVPGLELRVTDNVVTVACTDCSRDVLSLAFPPGGLRSHDRETLPAAFDRQHRHRIGLLADGNCPECGGATRTRLSVLEEESDGTDEATSVDAGLRCETCGYQLRCPVTLTVLEDPGVVAFFHDHGIDIADRPVWNVGSEWRERVVSPDPLVVRVTARLDGELLSLFLGRDGRVVYRDRSTVDPAGAVDGDDTETREETETDIDGEPEPDPDPATA